MFFTSYNPNYTPTHILKDKKHVYVNDIVANDNLSMACCLVMMA